jgi:hypothetical protein
MPEVSRFYGIVIRMYLAEYFRPCFHAMHGEHEALISIEELRVIAGGLLSTVFSLVRE